MDIIIERSVLFRRLVVNDFAKNYRLKSVKNFAMFLNRPDNFYCKNNYMIIHNTVLNDRYKFSLDITKYSIVFLLYKNINYSKKDYGNIARLDRYTKQTMKTVLQKYNGYNNISSEILIIGRKYTNVNDKDEKTNNCFGKICTYDINNVVLTDCVSSDILSDNSSTSDNISEKLPETFSKSILRRRFLYNLQQFIDVDSSVRNCINNGVYLDVEYTNDIYDNFETFPISNDQSILFMIGIYNRSYYHNFITDNLSHNEEHRILDNFLLRLNEVSGKIHIFHWSNADKYIIDKTLQRYPDLVKRYDNVIKRIVFVDLLKVVKLTIPGLQSYSLKYVCKSLLNIIYDTKCQNGLDAMCSIIENDLLLKTELYTEKNLLYFHDTKDVVNYNKLDTTLLYDIVKYFLRFS